MLTLEPLGTVAVVLSLPTHGKASDEEAKEKADFDTRCKAALGIAVDDKPLAKAPCGLVIVWHPCYNVHTFTLWS